MAADARSLVTRSHLARGSRLPRASRTEAVAGNQDTKRGSIPPNPRLVPQPVVELSFFDFACQLDSAQCYFRIPECLEPQHRITSLRRHPVILLNHVIQVLVGPDERLSGQDALGLQFGDGLMGCPTAVERDLLRDIITADRLHEEAYGGRFLSILTQQEIYILALLIDRAVEIAPLTLHFEIGFIDSPG